MLFDPHILIERPLHILAVIAIIMVGKTLAAIYFGFILPLSNQYCFNSRTSLAQIGEFSFILATLGVSLGLLTLEAQNLILAGALFSITLNSFIFSAIEPVQR